MKIKTFIFFRDYGSPQLDKDLEELKNYKIEYLILSGSHFTKIPHTLSNIVLNDKIAKEIREFIDYAYNSYGFKVIIQAGKRISDELFLDKNFVKKQAEFIAKGIAKLKDTQGLYALYIEDEPYRSWKNLTPEYIRDHYNGEFFKETGLKLPEQGPIRWDLKLALTYCKWVSQKYLEYLKTIISRYKEIDSEIKSIVNLDSIAMFPSADNPFDMQGLTEIIDILMIDIYPGWCLLPKELDNVVDFRTKFVRDLSSKPVWVILQGHKIILGYAPTLEQIEKWVYDAIGNSCEAIGWYACDHEHAPNLRANFRTMSTKYTCKERWLKMLEMCKIASNMEVRGRKRSSVAILTSLNSILGYGHASLFYQYLTLKEGVGIKTDFLTERLLLKMKKIPSEYRVILLNLPIANEEILPYLEDFVKNGGLIIACTNDLLYDSDGKELKEWKKKLFGVEKEQSLWNDFKIKITGIRGTKDQLKTYWERKAIIKHAPTVKVIAIWENKKPAILLQEIGKGRTIYIGTRPYLAYGYRDETGWAIFMKALINSSYSRNL